MIAGQAFFVHNEYREHDLDAEDVGPGAQLHEQVRARLHSHRGANEALLLHFLLRKVAVQHRHRQRERARHQGTRILFRSFPPATTSLRTQAFLVTLITRVDVKYHYY